MQAAKQDALNTISQRPDTADLEEIKCRLYVLDKATTTVLGDYPQVNHRRNRAQRRSQAHSVYDHMNEPRPGEHDAKTADSGRGCGDHSTHGVVYPLRKTLPQGRSCLCYCRH